MPSPLLDIDDLLAPIRGEEGPAGQRLPGQDRDKLDRDRIELVQTPQDPYVENKPADWNAIESDTQRLLRTTTKDLLLAARLLEALLKKYGFQGAAEGLPLFERLIEDCWDRLYPPIRDADDLDRRLPPFEWLDDPEAGAWFPASVRHTPLFREPQPLSFDDHQRFQNAKAGAEVPDFFALAAQAPDSEVRGNAAHLEACVASVDRIVARLRSEDRMGSLAPPLTRMRLAFKDCADLLSEILKRRGGAAAPSESTESAADESAPTSEKRSATASRAQLYARIREAADRLAEMEPHSPIPYLVKRAVDLGALPFPEMIKAFIRDDSVLREMRRELGITPSDD